MSITDAIGRISQIQATLVQLETPQRATALNGSSSSASSAVSSAASSTSATDFASALSGALGATDTASTGGPTGADVVADAKKYLGVPYVFGGTSASGLDCSGLVQRVFKDLGVDVPRLVSGQSTVGTEVPSLAQAQPGDLIVTNGGEHIVIYAGDGKVIHAPSEGRNVSLVNNWMDDSDIVTIRRVLPQAAPAAAAAATSATSVAGTAAGSASASSAQADMMRSLFASLMQGGSL
ncbi:C40 family peptidase [Leifsonia sp. fls2-241-R2A-40a]|uniref:C40 family peptidase n=1 Tax=Leifsonia sp. fls2-241-R2A-40a TaxID=3040290 RepID=UPI002550E113|nr:C40 family peptidase [Leifsonia sp. fls2-241-R2A-40a]